MALVEPDVLDLAGGVTISENEHRSYRALAKSPRSTYNGRMSWTHTVFAPRRPAARSWSTR